MDELLLHTHPLLPPDNNNNNCTINQFDFFMTKNLGGFGTNYPTILRYNLWIQKTFIGNLKNHLSIGSLY